ncbi:hypothetical protein GGX14DRAFT_532294 [Mycena pura]|uniref:DNase I-like protein n=1 Tax=Mycena pura TaxID=153505 RepID=A0AAD7E0X6_9AGAR|nr:hypothetical protein GGX14DRAFT_532294 [Mycena pura]
MLEENIGLLVVSETHMSQAQVTEIEESHMKKRLKIFNSPDPDNPSTKGIALVVNRETMNIHGIRINYLIPGRALLAVVPYHGKHTHTVLALYGPTESVAEKVDFYDQLCNLYLTTDLPVPDSLVGDLNFVEDERDRLPHHPDDARVVTAFLRLKRLLGLCDGWRDTNPDELAYTYVSTRKDPTLSRLDRIYVPPAAMKFSRNWEISDALGKLTDHKMITVTINAPGSPFIGPGRYTLPLFLVHDKDFTTFAVNRFAKLEQELTQVRTEKYALVEALERGRALAKTKIGASAQKRLKNRKQIALKLNPGRRTESPTGPADGSGSRGCSLVQRKRRDHRPDFREQTSGNKGAGPH